MSGAASRFRNDLRYRTDDHEAQRQLTPPYVLEPVREAMGGRIALDPCTEPNNPTAADRFFTVDDDGAALPWDEDSIFVNPPYSKARERWVNRCIEAGGAGKRVVLLIPAATDTRIFQAAIGSASAMVLIRGRVKFGVLRKNGRQEAASHPSALIGWNVDLAPCAHLGRLVPLEACVVTASEVGAVPDEMVEAVAQAFMEAWWANSLHAPTDWDRMTAHARQAYLDWDRMTAHARQAYLDGARAVLSVPALAEVIARDAKVRELIGNWRQGWTALKLVRAIAALYSEDGTR